MKQGEWAITTAHRDIFEAQISHAMESTLEPPPAAGVAPFVRPTYDPNDVYVPPGGYVCVDSPTGISEDWDEDGGEDWGQLNGKQPTFDPVTGCFSLGSRSGKNSLENSLEDLPRLVRSLDDDWARVECAGLRRGAA